MTAPLLQLRSVSKSFGAVRALRGVSFDLQPGEVHALLGENGAGKSTLIKIITGAHPPEGGSLEIHGHAVAHLTPATAHRLGIACIYQQPALFPDLTVAENIALRLEPASALRRVDWAARRARAGQLLQRLGAHLSTETEARSLSMPEQQLVEIACALGAEARILILDEPTASLTQREVALLFDLVRGLRANGAGIIYITHRLEEIFALADRVTVLRDGESLGSRSIAPPAVARPDSEPGPTNGTPASVTESELIQLMVGREVSSIFPPRENAPGDVVLALHELGCSRSGVRNITLELRAGEITGLAGLVGAGRTELARVLFGITPADSGELRLDGRPIRVRSPREAVAHGIAYVPEDRRRHGVIPEMSAAANMTMAAHRRLFPGTWLRRETERRLALDFIRELGVKTSDPDAPAGSLSGGNQQKVALARWLVTQPRVLILDEPTQGVDVGAKAEIHKIIRHLARRGLAVLMISSDLPEILGMSDRIAVLRDGTLAALLPGNSNAQAVMAAALGQEERRSPKAERPAAEEISARTRSDPASPRPSAVKILRSHFRECSVAATLAVLLLGLAFAAPAFFGRQQLLATLTTAAPVLIAACGMALVILSRQIDISIGSQFALCSVVAGLVVKAGGSMPVVALGAVVTGAVLGAFNGALVAGLGLPSIVVTLATMVTWRETLRWWREGEFVKDLPDRFQWFGLGQGGGQAVILFGAALVFGVLVVAMKQIAAGRFVHAIGTDREAARLAGIRPQAVTFAVFVLLGALVGLAALLNAIRFADVDPKTGTGLEMQAIAAAVVGGVSVSGGRGTLWGVLAGVLLLACIAPALVFLKMPPQWEKAIQGGIILLAVTSERLRTLKPLRNAIHGVGNPRRVRARGLQQL